jgi:hypothetical protein
MRALVAHNPRSRAGMRPINLALVARLIAGHLVLGQALAFSSRSSSEKNGVTSDEDSESNRYRLYAHHGIQPELDFGTPSLADAPSVKSSMNHGRVRARRAQCLGIGCLTPSFRGRFGSSNFDVQTLKLPGKKGVCYLLNDDTESRISRLKYLRPSWNYSWSSKVRRKASVLRVEVVSRIEEISSTRHFHPNAVLF